MNEPSRKPPYSSRKPPYYYPPSKHVSAVQAALAKPHDNSGLINALKGAACGHGGKAIGQNRAVVFFRGGSSGGPQAPVVAVQRGDGDTAILVGITTFGEAARMYGTKKPLLAFTDVAEKTRDDVSVSGSHIKKPDGYGVYIPGAGLY